MKLKQLSVFFPAYNEEENIQTTIENAVKVLRKVAAKWEIIVINDGSTDKTGEVLKQMVKKNSRLRVITHQPNQGYGAALKTGIYACKYNLICYTDSDGQFKFGEIHRFIKALNAGADMVIGFRINRTDNPYRRFMAKILHLVGVILFNIDIKDVDCGFKLFKKKIIDTIGSLKTSSAITETELVARTKKAGFSIAQVGVKHHSRTEGEQTGGKPSVIIKAAIEGLKLWAMLLKEK